MRTCLKGKKIVRISTVPFFVNSQLREQLTDIANSGASVNIITSPAKSYENKIKFPDITSLYEIEIARGINLKKDIFALWKIYLFLIKNRVDIIHSTTPKAGLLSSIAGLLARTPFRFHTFTGQTWVEKKGVIRRFFILIDRLMVKLNTHCYADSHSQVDFLVSEGVCHDKKISVLGNGSLAGVNTERFDPDKFSENWKSEFRSSLNLSEDELVLIYVGRIAKDKGITELFEAFEKLLDKGIKASLLLVGPLDCEFVIDNMSLEDYVTSTVAIKALGFTTSPEKFLAISDIFCLPSYREGFGTVILESASMGIPAVASNIYGLRDAVVDDETGILVDVKDSNSLLDALVKLSNDNELRARMGNNARERVKKYYKSEIVNKLVIDEYVRLLNE